jgi:hypothetical protein
MTNASRIPHGHEGMDGYPVSKDNYIISVDDSLNGLAFHPEQHMPLPVDDLAYGPLALTQIDLSRKVVLHALSFPSLDAYIDHSISLAVALSEPYPVPRSVLYWGCTPLQLHTKAFGRHVGFAISQEHERLDELLEGMKQAFLRGDVMMQAINSEQAFGTAFYRLHSTKSESEQVVSLTSPSGKVRSLGFFTKLMGKHLQELILGAFKNYQTPVIQAVVLGQEDDAVFAEYLRASPPVLAANQHVEAMGLQDARAYRSAIGLSPFPERQEIHKRFESLLKSEHPFEKGQVLDLYEYAHGNAQAWQSAVQDCFQQSAEWVKNAALQRDVVNSPAYQSALRALASCSKQFITSGQASAKKLTRESGLELVDVTRNILVVFMELEDTVCPVKQMATACLCERGTESHAAIMETPEDGLLEWIAKLYTPEQCSTSPNLLAVLFCQPKHKIRAWAEEHDPEDKVLSFLYKVTNDTQYLQMVKSLVVRGELFGQDLGL